MTKESILADCTIEGTIVKLPNVQLDRKLYTDVAKSLKLIGGKWKGGKVAGFVFPEDPTDLLAQIANGEKRNLKKEFQFFGTPDTLADRLVELADPKEGESLLEPSAGQGAIVKAIQRYAGNIKVCCYEIMELNRTFLFKIPTVSMLGEDFLIATPKNKFDKIIANPPFSKNQDVDHIRKMYEVCADGGRIVSIASKHWQHSTKNKEKLFRSWLSDIDAEIHEIEAGEFKESGTNIATVIIVIDK